MNQIVRRLSSAPKVRQRNESSPTLVAEDALRFLITGYLQGQASVFLRQCKFSNIWNSLVDDLVLKWWNNAKRPRKWPGGSGVRIANLMSNDNYKRDQTKHVCRKHGGDASEIFRRSSAAMRCRKVKLLFRYAGWSRSQWSLTWSRKTNWFCEESRTTVLYPTCANKPETQWTKAGQIQIWCVRQSAN